MKLGIVVHVIQNPNIYIVDVGWGQLRYFFEDKDCQIKDIILYEEPYYNSVNSNEIKFVCCFDDCDFLGNVRFDFRHPCPGNIVIARKDNFSYWDSFGYKKDFDLISNTLLFLSHAKPRYPFPDEKDWLEAYTYAKKKVEELDIPQVINESKVIYHNHSWAMRCSENVIICNYSISYDYDYLFDYIHASYLEKIFPQYEEKLYHSVDDNCDFIHPDYEKMKIIRKPDGSISEVIEEKFKGMDIKEYCLKKTKELRQLALENYKSYNKDEHINSIAYHHMNWYDINKENIFFQKMKGLAEVIWGFKHQELIEQINKDNYSNLIENNNANHPLPYIID